MHVNPATRNICYSAVRTDGKYNILVSQFTVRIYFRDCVASTRDTFTEYFSTVKNTTQLHYPETRSRYPSTSLNEMYERKCASIIASMTN